jgi:DNA-binding response OmpR family regulator
MVDRTLTKYLAGTGKQMPWQKGTPMFKNSALPTNRNPDASPGNETGGGAQEAPRRLRLLIVDEDACALAAMGKRLSHLLYDVTLAHNGFVALNCMMAQQFDLILVDMGMTMVTGIETIRKMHGSGLLARAPIVAIAGQGQDSNVIEALGAGADDHIVKPFDFDVLDARIRHSVARARQVTELERYNELMDARIARRAMELGETKAELEELRADRQRLIASIQTLHSEIERLTVLH